MNNNEKKYVVCFLWLPWSWKSMICNELLNLLWPNKGQILQWENTRANRLDDLSWKKISISKDDFLKNKDNWKYISVATIDWNYYWTLKPDDYKYMNLKDVSLTSWNDIYEYFLHKENFEVITVFINSSVEKCIENLSLNWWDVSRIKRNVLLEQDEFLKSNPYFVNIMVDWNKAISEVIEDVKEKLGKFWLLL